MEVLYRVAGLVARVNEAMSRTSVNLVPGNVAVILLLVLGVVGSAGATRTSLAYRGPATPTTVADLLGGKVPEGTYVELRGELHPEVGLVNSSTGRSFVPLFGPGRLQGILIERAGDRSPSGEAHASDAAQATTIRGIVGELDRDLKAKLDETHGKLEEGMEVSSALLVRERRASPSPWIGFAAAVGLTALLALFVGTWALRYVVFRRDSRLRAAAGAEEQGSAWDRKLELRASGVFEFEEGGSRRFLDVPSALVLLDSGDLLLASRIDASSRSMGVVTKKRVGIWSVSLPIGAIKRAERGRQFIGLKAMPALRLTLSPPQGSGSPQRLLIGCASEQDLGALISRLEEAGHALAA